MRTGKLNTFILGSEISLQINAYNLFFFASEIIGKQFGVIYKTFIAWYQEPFYRMMCEVGCDNI
jgi:hypothetical protein